MVSASKQNAAELQPAWDIARLYPPQGYWSEEEYLGVTHSTNWLVEFKDGHVEVLPMPKRSHQRIVAYLYGLLLAFVTQSSAGEVLFAPLRVRLRPGLFREPDIAFMKGEHANRSGEDAWEGADLVIEVVSEGPEDRIRDLEHKRREYAEARIPEYWIVDPVMRTITVLTLPENAQRYEVAGVYREGDVAASVLLDGFVVGVQHVWEAAEQVPRSQ